MDDGVAIDASSARGVVGQPPHLTPLEPVDIIITIAWPGQGSAQYIKRGTRWYRRALPFQVPLLDQIEDCGTNWEPTNLRTAVRELQEMEASPPHEQTAHSR